MGVISMVNDQKLVRVYIVGGFLGAGKTTALTALAGRLAAKGLRSAIVTNDRTAGLVDSEIVRAKGIAFREISGSCICCQFKDYLNAADTLLQEFQPDAILTEPIGTCAGLPETILKPLRAYTQDRYEVMPLSVLADPQRVVDSLGTDSPSGMRSSTPESIRTLIENQLDEADRILLTKADIIPEEILDRARQLIWERFGAKRPSLGIQTISAITGQGLDEWLDALEEPQKDSAETTVIDREQHQRAEASLGWLNLEARLYPAASWQVDLTAFVQGFFARLLDRLQGTFIGHLKLFAESKTGTLKANVTDWQQGVSVEMLEPADESSRQVNEGAWIVINLRAAQSPEALEENTVRSIKEIADIQQAKVEIVRCNAVRPDGPEPLVSIELMNKKMS